jgi:hypothetical protein
MIQTITNSAMMTAEATYPSMIPNVKKIHDFRIFGINDQRSVSVEMRVVETNRQDWKESFLLIGDECHTVADWDEYFQATLNAPDFDGNNLLLENFCRYCALREYAHVSSQILPVGQKNYTVE